MRPSDEPRPQVEDDDGDGELFKPQAAAAASEAGMNRMYGVWQTRPWAPPAARGGQVPKNERGQVDCPPYSLALPEGAHCALGFLK